MTSTIAIIPARGGSKKLPRKNILPLNGKPLLSYTIRAAQESKLLDRVVLSTDDDEIAEVGQACGVEVPFRRPAELATDLAHSPDVVEHAVAFVEASEGVAFSNVVMLQPTSPLRTGAHIDTGIRRFLASDASSLISVKREEHPPWWMFVEKDRRLVPACEWPGVENVFNMERGEFPPVFSPNGAFYITAREDLRTRGELVAMDSCEFFVMDGDDSIDIDTELEMVIAETVLRRRDGVEKTE